MYACRGKQVKNFFTCFDGVVVIVCVSYNQPNSLYCCSVNNSDVCRRLAENNCICGQPIECVRSVLFSCFRLTVRKIKYYGNYNYNKYVKCKATSL